MHQYKKKAVLKYCCNVYFIDLGGVWCMELIADADDLMEFGFVDQKWSSNSSFRIHLNVNFYI